MFSRSDIERFHNEGYLIARGLGEPSLCERMAEITRAALADEIGPLEYEVDTGYPGAPTTRDALGGQTIRRLLQAYSRHPLFQAWARSRQIITGLQQLLGPRLVLSQMHHNCIMTKHPKFSSGTYWHQDIRYWSFARPELISVWLALTPEYAENGCLSLLPGSHTLTLSPERLDEALFLRPGVPENEDLIAGNVTAELSPGDVLFFHCRTFHAAGRNQTTQLKFSLAFTYRAEDNPPTLGTRSARLPEIALPREISATSQTCLDSPGR